MSNTDVNARITTRPDVCGGDACIRGTRIMVWLLASFRRQGVSEADLLDWYPTLTRADLQAAWQYEADHPADIDRGIRENEDA
jgi:uncharacterized protein (DUF433 family)